MTLLADDPESLPDDPPAQPDHRRPLSQVLQEVAELPADSITIAELVQRFGGRALGALLLLFALLCLLPLPPGATTVFGAPLLLLSGQLMIGRHMPWLPGRIRRRSVPLGEVRGRLPQLARWMRRIERISRPRLTFMFSPLGERILGATCVVLSLILILPIWGGNILPAMAVAVLSLSLILKDGLLAILGYILVAVSGAVLVLATHIIIRLLQHAWAVVSGA